MAHCGVGLQRPSHYMIAVCQSTDQHLAQVTCPVLIDKLEAIANMS